MSRVLRARSCVISVGRRIDCVIRHVQISHMHIVEAGFAGECRRFSLMECGLSVDAMRDLQNLVSARPWPSAASPQASSALRMQRRRTKPLRGGPTAPSPMEFEWLDPGPLDAPEGPFGLTDGPSRGCVDVMMLSAGPATRGVPTPPVEGGRSRTRV